MPAWVDVWLPQMAVIVDEVKTAKQEQAMKDAQRG